MQNTTNEDLKQFQSSVAALTKHRVRVLGLLSATSEKHVRTEIEVNCTPNISKEQMEKVLNARDALFTHNLPPPFDMSKLQHLRAIQSSEQYQLLKRLC